MFAVISPSEVGKSGAPRLQRARGHARIAFRQRGAVTLLDRLYQEGAAKIRLPRPDAGVPEAVLINTAGGLTGGDALSTEVVLGAGAQAVVTTQACERIYRSAGGTAAVSTRLELGTNARLDWLPQETILFDRAHLARRLDAELAAGAQLLALEAVVFGRTAMGETVGSGAFSDRWQIRYEGRLVFADSLRFDGAIARQLARPAVLAGAGAMATVLYAGPEPERLLDPVRAAIGEAGGASAWDGKLVARLAGADGFALRRTLVAVLSRLMAGRALPRVWQI